MKGKGILKKAAQFFGGDDSNKTGADKPVDIDLWEEDYLVKKIQCRHCHVPEETIRAAVKSCYLIFRSPQPGEKLVQCVIDKLKDA